MLDVDLEEFAYSGKFGPFDFTSTREKIEGLLGPGDPGGYPEFVTYGHVAFDLGGGDGPPCRIMVAFPHPACLTPARSNWPPPAWANQWPDSRFCWNLGRFIPGLYLDDSAELLDRFVESEMLSSSNGLRIFHNFESRVDLLFEIGDDSNRVSLSSMVAHPRTVVDDKSLDPSFGKPF